MLRYSFVRFPYWVPGRVRWTAGCTLPILTLVVAAIGLQVQAEQPLTEPQHQVVVHVKETLLAPCCWRESLTVHRSQTAADLRVEIASMARSGLTAEQITARMVERFGARILREPPGAAAGWLYVFPIIVCLGGFVLLTRFLRRNLRTNIRLAMQLPGKNWDEFDFD